jgi:curved DNA-binding protein CbpA
MGSLETTPLPHLVLGLVRDQFSGALVLEQARVTRRIDWNAGAPVAVASDGARETLAEVLVDRRRLDEAGLQVVRERCERAPSELAAVVSLGSVSAKDALLGLGEQLQRVLTNAVRARSGSFRLEVTPPEGPERTATAAVIPCDVPAAIHRAIADGWEVHEVLMQLGDRATGFPLPADGYEALLPLLEGVPVQEFRARLTGRVSAFDLTRELAEQDGHATLLMLDALGGLLFHPEPVEAEAGPESAEVAEQAVDVGPIIEIQVTGAPAAEEATAHPEAAAARDETRDAAAEVLRDVILDLHGELGSLSYYALLNVESDANAATVKRGYLKAAKRLHPDNVSRMGLDDLKEQANELFTQIARAYEVLSDTARRESYDAAQAGHTDIDANRLAQAELLYRKGDTLLRTGDFRGALEFLEGAVRYWPDEADYQAALAWALHRTTPPQSERALEHFERSLELAPSENAQWLLRMSLVLKELGHTQRARELEARAKARDRSVRA